MILVRRSAAGLADGYAALLAFQERLKNEWEPRLWRRYVRQQASYRQAQQKYNARPRLIRWLLPAPRPPKRPLRYPQLLTHYFEPVRQQWLAAMRSTPKIEIPSPPQEDPGVAFGKQGERNVLDWLADRLDDRFLATCRLHMNHPDKADADILLVGPKGYWYFEVKSWKGDIQGFGDNPWLQTKNNGEEKSQTSPIWAWRRVAEELGQIFRPLWSDPLAHLPLLQPKGGVVFSTSQAECRLHIVDGSNVLWGHLRPFWDKQLDEAKIIPAATPQQMFRMMDAALARHQQLHPEKKVVSLTSIAHKTIQTAENSLQKLLS